MIAGYTMLNELKNNPAIYDELNKKTKYLKDGLNKVLEGKNIPHRINQMGSMMSLHFCDHDVMDFDTASCANLPLFNKFFHHLLENGIYLPPSGYESWFLSNALSQNDLNATIEACKTFTF